MTSSILLERISEIFTIKFLTCSVWISSKDVIPLSVSDFKNLLQMDPLHFLLLSTVLDFDKTIKYRTEWLCKGYLFLLAVYFPGGSSCITYLCKYTNATDSPVVGLPGYFALLKLFSEISLLLDLFCFNCFLCP